MTSEIQGQKKIIRSWRSRPLEHGSTYHWEAWTIKLFHVLSFDRIDYQNWTVTGGPFLYDEDGMDLQPNTLTQIAIQQTQISRMPFPYVSDCYQDWNSTDYGLLVVEGATKPMPYSIDVSSKVMDF